MMKYWEIVKNLSENPTLRGVAVIGSTRYEIHVDDSGTLQSDTYYSQLGTKGTSIGNAGNIDFDGWEIFRQPVTWQEAIQAWSEGKIVSLEFCVCKYLFADTRSPELTRRMIQYGTWYVED